MPTIFFHVCRRLFFVCGCIIPLSGWAQNHSLPAFMARAEDWNTHFPVEKIFLHTDKRTYAQGDTLWFKAYVFQDDLLTGTENSGVMDLELVNEASGYRFHLRAPLRFGLGWGSLALDDDHLLPGHYTLYAYTNWLRNFGTPYFFQTTIQVIGRPRRNWYVQYQPGNGGALLRFTRDDQHTMAFFPLRVSWSDGQRPVHPENLRTSADGTLRFPIAPAKSFLDLEDSSGQKVRIPLPSSDSTDVQFLPEGGYLVAELPAHVGFKAVGNDGLPRDVQGVVRNHQGDSITTFQSMHDGMGSFFLLPHAGEKYKAFITWPDGSSQNYALPSVQASGTSLQVNQAGRQWQVIVASTRPHDTLPYLLVAQVGQQLYYAASLRLDPGGRQVSLSADSLPAGVVRFSLLNAKWQTSNERLVFNTRPAAQTLEIHPAQTIYHPGDSIALTLQYRDNSGAPVIGSFSAAVTDDAQVPADTTGENNIALYLQLQSALRGAVYHPAYYFHAGNAAALDHLMLTQGWTGAGWDSVLTQTPLPVFAPQPDLSVAGRVTNRAENASKGTHVRLLSMHPFYVRDTVTDADGRFIFTNLLPEATAYTISATNRHDRDRNVQLSIPAAYAQELPHHPALVQHPWNVNMDTLAFHYLQNSLHNFNQPLLKGTTLKTVEIIEKKSVKLSANYNGPGNADQVFDEADMGKQPGQHLSDFLLQNIKGLTVDMFNKTLRYMLGSQPVEFVLDGVPAATATQGADSGSMVAGMQMTKGILDQFTGADLLGVEVLYSPGFTNLYDIHYDHDTDVVRPVYVEITTRARKGPFVKTMDDSYTYHPFPVSMPKAFYRPRYTNTDTTGLAEDTRSTLHWEPNIMTDQTGQAHFSFFAAGRPGTYTVLLQGCDMNGHVISGYTQLTVQ